jgi:hypothetical protein
MSLGDIAIRWKKKEGEMYKQSRGIRKVQKGKR